MFQERVLDEFVHRESAEWCFPGSLLPLCQSFFSVKHLEVSILEVIILEVNILMQAVPETGSSIYFMEFSFNCNGLQRENVQVLCEGWTKTCSHVI